MQKSFYSKEYSISIRFLENGTLSGLFAAKDLHLNEIKGIYSNLNNDEVSISFFIDWTLKGEKGHGFTAFHGLVRMNCEIESLFLNWLLVIENQYGQNIANMKNDSILTSDIDSLNLTSDYLKVPYPVDALKSNPNSISIL